MGLFRDVAHDAGQAWSGQFGAERAPTSHVTQLVLPPHAEPAPAGVDFRGVEEHTDTNESREGRRVPSTGVLPVEQQVVEEARRSTLERSRESKSDVDSKVIARGGSVPVFDRGSELLYAFGSAERNVTVKRQARKGADAGPPSWNSSQANSASFEPVAEYVRTPTPFIAVMRTDGPQVVSTNAVRSPLAAVAADAAALAESSGGSAQDVASTATTRSPTLAETTSGPAVAHANPSHRIARDVSRVDATGSLPDGMPLAATWPAFAPAVGTGTAGAVRGHRAEAQLQNHTAATPLATTEPWNDAVSGTASKPKEDEGNVAARAWVREPPAPMKWGTLVVEAVEQNAEVNIGVIEVVVEAPREASGRAAHSAPSGGAASRLYLRGL